MGTKRPAPIKIDRENPDREMSGLRASINEGKDREDTVVAWALIALITVLGLIGIAASWAATLQPINH